MERWLLLVLSCKVTVLLLAVLRRTWSQEHYEENGVGRYLERGWSKEDGDGDHKFNPKDLTDIQRSAFFRYYHRMMILVGQVPTKLQRWSDGCPCHETLLIGKTRHHQQVSLFKDGLPQKHCLATSCRPPEEIGAQRRSELQAAIDERTSDGVTDVVTPEDIILISRI